MRPETGQFFENARNMLMRGQPDAGGGSHEDAGHAAYPAAFRAAHALIFEREHRTLKTHGGVQSEFAKLVKDDQAVPAELRGFVSRAYAFNTITDYDPLTSVPPTADDARSPIETVRPDLSMRSRG